jgi:gas vesicle protein
MEDGDSPTKAVALQLLANSFMANDFEQLLKDVFGDQISRLSQFQSDQVKRLQSKLTEIAREAIKDDLAKLQNEIIDLRARIATLEAERVKTAAESLGSSF